MEFGPPVIRPHSEYYRGKFNQGKSATYLKNQYSVSRPYLAHDTYQSRTKRQPWMSYTGARPMHRTTLNLDTNKCKLDYLTLYDKYFKGSLTLEGVRRPPSCPSLFRPQWEISHGQGIHLKTMNEEMFQPKQVIPITEIRKPEVINKYKSTNGLKMMSVTDNNHGPSYVTSYRIDHDTLAKQRGNGVPHYRKKPPQFNVITGVNQTDTTPIHDYRRRSGNRILHLQRNRTNMYEIFSLG